GKKRHQPDCIHAQFLHVIQLLSEALKITDAIAITVTERAHVDLIDDRVFIPTCFALQWNVLLPNKAGSPGAGVNRIAMPAALRLVRASSTCAAGFARKSETSVQSDWDRIPCMELVGCRS